MEKINPMEKIDPYGDRSFCQLAVLRTLHQDLTLSRSTLPQERPSFSPSFSKQIPLRGQPKKARRHLSKDHSQSEFIDCEALQVKLANQQLGPGNRVSVDGRNPANHLGCLKPCKIMG